MNELVILFDEFGIPILNPRDSISNYFVGTSVLFNAKDQESILDNLNEVMGLSNTKELKKIKKDRAILIAESISKENIFITLKSLLLTNEDLKKSVDYFMPFVNYTRKYWRGISKEAKIQHFFHRQIWLTCIYDLVQNYFETANDGEYKIQIYIDDWSYPEYDRFLLLKESMIDLTAKINDYFDQHTSKKINCNFKPIKILKNADKRARFIGVLMSILSKAFLSDSKALDTTPKEIIEQSEIVSQFEDETSLIIKFMDDVIIKGVESTKNVEPKKIIS